jgi:hypothetical protein
MRATFRDIRPESRPRLQQPTDRADPMKMLLIATTALVCVTSLATAGTLPERQAGSGHSRLDANQEFLCNYGFKLRVFGYSSSSISRSFVSWERAATPVIGKGTAVNEIVVEDGPSTGTPSGFQVAIYTSHLGKPATELVSASATQPGCGRVKVPISPITLEYGKKYWIVQSVRLHPHNSEASNSIRWLYDQKRTHGALSQSGHSSSCRDHPGPWTPITGGVPFARVRESAGASELNRPPQSQGASIGAISPVAVPTRRGGHEGNIPRYPP